ncbi:MAG TPA: type II toxin-antitoxin system VapC family toxin [Thermoplasmata archaeon]|nr:type II toxin-antitoxin system VapC family toxin [Thermoplasmata archaeon]
MVYLDANVFVYAVTGDDSVPEAKRSRAHLRKVGAGELAGLTSTLTWDELVHVVAKRIGPIEARQAGTYFLGIPRLQVITVDRRIVKEAQRIHSSFGLKPRDAIHAASALTAGEPDVMSDDSAFSRVNGLRTVSI